MPTSCEFPDKHPYPSKGSAKVGRAGIYRNRASGKGRLVVFPCGGHWHIGHQRTKGTE